MVPLCFKAVVLFLKYKFIYFNWKLITLQYCIGFAMHWHEFATGVHVSQSWTPLPPPSSSHPSGLSSAPAPSTLYHALNLGCWFVSHMIIYMFQYHSPKSSTLVLSHRLQKTVLYICVSFAVLHIRLSLPFFKISFICISILYWCFSFWLTSLCIKGSSFIHLIRIDSNMFFLIAE